MEKLENKLKTILVIEDDNGIVNALNGATISGYNFKTIEYDNKRNNFNEIIEEISNLNPTPDVICSDGLYHKCFQIYGMIKDSKNGKELIKKFAIVTCSWDELKSIAEHNNIPCFDKNGFESYIQAAEYIENRNQNKDKS